MAAMFAETTALLDDSIIRFFLLCGLGRANVTKHVCRIVMHAQCVHKRIG